MPVRVLYREEGRTLCPACKRNVAATRASTEKVVRVSRHLFQIEPPNSDGHHTLDAGGFCPGSLELVKETLEQQATAKAPKKRGAR